MVTGHMVNLVSTDLRGVCTDWQQAKLVQGGGSVAQLPAIQVCSVFACMYARAYVCVCIVIAIAVIIRSLSPYYRCQRTMHSARDSRNSNHLCIYWCTRACSVTWTQHPPSQCSAAHAHTLPRTRAGLCQSTRGKFISITHPTLLSEGFSCPRPHTHICVARNHVPALSRTVTLFTGSPSPWRLLLSAVTCPCTNMCWVADLALISHFSFGNPHLAVDLIQSTTHSTIFQCSEAMVVSVRQCGLSLQ